ncbi:MAG: hypothetical protein K2Z81_07115 [Cyanobacteria bacterium]|nr:hypothetical protein [Cyanobacteriota bacterium]
MGLAVTVGILNELKNSDEEAYEFYRHQFTLLNVLLAENNLPPHNEPVEIAGFGCEMYGYSGLHYLRRIAAHLLVEGACPEPCTDDPTGDHAYDECYDYIATYQDARSKEEMRFDHLLCHSDAEGYYLPIEFDEVLYDLDDLGVVGVQVGSSVVLARECIALAAVLGLPADIDPADEKLFLNCDQQGTGSGWHSYGIESYSCIQLLAAARHSVTTGAAMVFH